MRITYGQMTSLLTLTLVVKIYVYAPSLMAERTGQNLWIPLLIAIIASMLVGWGMFKVSTFFPNETFVGMLQKLTGTYLGTLISFFYFIYFFILFTIHTQIIVTIFKTLFLPKTPVYATLLLVLLFALYCSFLGMEVLARASNMVLLLLIGVMFFLIFAVIPDVKLTNYQPFLPQNMDGILYGTLIAFSSYGQIVLISTIFPFVNRQKEKSKPKKVLWGILSGYLITGAIVIQSVGVFTPFELERLRHPTVEMITLIHVGEFMERLEIFLVTMWAGAMLLVTGIFFTTSCLTLKHVLKLNTDSTHLNLYLILLGFAGILIFIPNDSALTVFLNSIWVYLSLICQAVIPVFIGIIFFIRVKVMKHVPN